MQGMVKAEQHRLFCSVLFNYNCPKQEISKHVCMQFDSAGLEGSISDVKVTTLELKAELGKNTQKLLALTQRLETLGQRRPTRTMTRNHSMAQPHMSPATSMAPAPAPSMVSSPSAAAGLLATTADAATAEAVTTATGSDTAVAHAPAVAAVAQSPAVAAVGRSGSGAAPSVNFAADALAGQQSPAITPETQATPASGMPMESCTGVGWYTTLAPQLQNKYCSCIDPYCCQVHDTRTCHSLLLRRCNTF